MASWLARGRSEAGGMTVPALQWFACLCAAVASLAFFPVSAWGQDDPSARVGRVADFAGQLYLSPEDRAVDWAEIGLNTTITTGDNLWVTEDGRAEVDYGGGQFRLYGDT